MKKIIYLFLIGLSVVTSGCYEDFEQDNPFSAVYFPFQQPIRTVISDDPNFTIGVVLAGKRENNANERVTVSFDESLLTDPARMVLPSDYFSMGFDDTDSTIVIPAGTFWGDVPVTLNSTFFDDPESVRGTYVIPLRITRFSADSVLTGKFFTLAAVRYINPFHGVYYKKGSDQEDGVADPTTYSETDLVKNIRTELRTENKNTILYSGIGIGSGLNVNLSIGSDNSVTGELIPDSGNLDMDDTNDDVYTQTSGSYDPTTKTITLAYTYVVDGGTMHTVSEELIYTTNAGAFQVDEW